MFVTLDFTTTRSTRRTKQQWKKPQMWYFNSFWKWHYWEAYQKCWVKTCCSNHHLLKEWCTTVALLLTCLIISPRSISTPVDSVSSEIKFSPLPCRPSTCHSIVIPSVPSVRLLSSFSPESDLIFQVITDSPTMLTVSILQKEICALKPDRYFKMTGTLWQPQADEGRTYFFAGLN